jgi:hypothetical protein
MGLCLDDEESTIGARKKFIITLFLYREMNIFLDKQDKRM